MNVCEDSNDCAGHQHSQHLRLFANKELGVVPAVYTELVAGVREGYSFLQTAVDLIESSKLRLFIPTPEEVLQRVHLPSSLSDGESESIALCKSRGAAFLTNDRRARNFCLSEGVEVFDLIEVLRALWKLSVRSKRQVRQLLAEIEAREGIIIKRKEEIFG